MRIAGEMWWLFHRHVFHLSKAPRESAVLTSRQLTPLSLMIGSAFALSFARSRAGRGAALYQALKHRSARKRCSTSAAIHGKEAPWCASQWPRLLAFRRTHGPQWDLRQSPSRSRQKVELERDKQRSRVKRRPPAYRTHVQRAGTVIHTQADMASIASSRSLSTTLR